MKNRDDAPIQPFRDLQHALPIALLRSRESVMRHFRPMLARHGVTEQQWRVIRVLAEAGRLDASEVGLRAVILGPSLSRIIPLLEARGLIVRSRDEADGRRIFLALTARGQRFIREVAPDSNAIYEKIEKKYGAGRLAELLSLLDALSVMDEASAPDADQPPTS